MFTFSGGGAEGDTIAKFKGEPFASCLVASCPSSTWPCGFVLWIALARLDRYKCSLMLVDGCLDSSSFSRQEIEYCSGVPAQPRLKFATPKLLRTRQP